MPLQRLSDEKDALEARVAALEQAVETLRLTPPADPDARSPEIDAEADAVIPTVSGIRWPHMADNIFLGLVALVAAHWLATTLPAGNRTTFRLVALIVALPFGYRFERNTRSGAAVRVIAALASGCLGTVALGLLDMAVGGVTARSLSAPDVIASVAAIALSHFAGSGLAQLRQRRAEGTGVAPPHLPAALLPHLEAARLKTTAETVKAMYEAAAPIAAGAAAVWAACTHILS